MKSCPICGTSFDERAFQLVIHGVGAFDTVSCAEEGARRARRRARDDLAADLADVAQAGAADGVRQLIAGPRARPTQ